MEKFWDEAADLVFREVTSGVVVPAQIEQDVVDGVLVSHPVIDSDPVHKHDALEDLLLCVRRAF